ncbi:hypothetical protein BU26DRAFT_567829 [Trematosphaeria pertusa]|uniref:Uncharacterized protein n=1 Tax=Trematosphaeria pertusa TaxID=390896 RepID=A0A6A6I7J3_9PLEO|nr:uncharacterized protein BU26DRAFT_567829 [Trematosphaeria pertusa]KAF2246341.1 hypothetical protein BU26DRAFT_567829 [Trematosphaeria pertusa]
MEVGSGKNAATIEYVELKRQVKDKHLLLVPPFDKAQFEDGLKAIVKYCFLLATASNLHQFTNHCIPWNVTFEEHMRGICERLGTADSQEGSSVPESEDGAGSERSEEDIQQTQLNSSVGSAAQGLALPELLFVVTNARLTLNSAFAAQEANRTGVLNPDVLLEDFLRAVD